MAFTEHTGYNTAVAVSPDGNYVATTMDIAPYLMIHKRTGREFSRVALGSPPNYKCYGVDWHPSGDYLAVIKLDNYQTHYPVMVYKRAGDTFTPISVPSINQILGNCVKWSHNGALLAAGFTAYTSSGRLTVLEFNASTETLTALSTIDTQPGDGVGSIDFSADDAYMAVASSGFGNPPPDSAVTVYKITGGNYFTKLFTPSLIPRRAYAVRFDNTGTHLAIGCSAQYADAGAPTLLIFKRSGDTFSALTTADWYSGATVRSLAYSADGSKLLVASASYTAVQMVLRSGDAYTAGPASSTMGGYIQAISVDASMRYLIAVSNTSGYSRPFVWFGAYPTGQIPSGGLISQDTDNTFTWSIGNDYPDLFSSVQTAAKFRYLESSEEDYVETDIPDGTQSYTVPADTFTAASVDWQVQIQSADGFWTDETAWFTLETGEDSLSAAECVSPVNAAVNGTISNTFAWRHIIDTGTEPTGADLQYRPEGGEWAALASVTGSATSTIIPANTLPGGNVNWRVRTYNSDNEAGAWSDAAYIAVRAAPAVPSITSITNAARPVIRWQSSGQVSYEIVVTRSGVAVYSTGEVAGADKRHAVANYLDDGAYIVKLRVKNLYAIWSDWATGAVTVATAKPAAPVITAEPVANGVRITVDADPTITIMYLLRDGVPIARISGDYTDYTSIGSVSYLVRGVDASDNFADSVPVSAAASVSSAQLAACDAPADMIALTVRRGSLPSLSGSFRLSGAARTYAGREYPLYTFSEFASDEATTVYSCTRQADFDALIALARRRRTLLYRDERGQRFWCVVTGVPYSRDRIGHEFTLQLQRVDYVERIDYDPPEVV